MEYNLNKLMHIIQCKIYIAFKQLFELRAILHFYFLYLLLRQIIFLQKGLCQDFIKFSAFPLFPFCFSISHFYLPPFSIFPYSFFRYRGYLSRRACLFEFFKNRFHDYLRLQHLPQWVVSEFIFPYFNPFPSFPIFFLFTLSSFSSSPPNLFLLSHFPSFPISPLPLFPEQNVIHRIQSIEYNAISLLPLPLLNWRFFELYSIVKNCQKVLALNFDFKGVKKDVKCYPGI